jgi:hypothetical protein
LQPAAPNTDNTKKDVKEIKVSTSSPFHIPPSPTNTPSQLRLYYIEHGEEGNTQFVRELSSTIPFANLKAGKPLEQTWYRGDDASSGSAFDKKNYSAGYYSPLFSDLR